MTKTCLNSHVMWVLFSLSFFFCSLSSSCLFLFFFFFFSPASFNSFSFFLSLSSSCLFLQLLLISFFFSSPISFLNFVLFLSLFLLSRSVDFFCVGLCGTFYGFLCSSIYKFYLDWYGILMVISSF
ncbi:hypothetical protein ACB092_09G174300 [Castanea dentata]